jgi:hypothetical protein
MRASIAGVRASSRPTPLDEKWSIRAQSSFRNWSSRVRAVTIASLMDEAGLDRVDILKLDIVRVPRSSSLIRNVRSG